MRGPNLTTTQYSRECSHLRFKMREGEGGSILKANVQLMIGSKPTKNLGLHKLLKYYSTDMIYIKHCIITKP